MGAGKAKQVYTIDKGRNTLKRIEESRDGGTWKLRTSDLWHRCPDEEAC
jgi:hypothetical protein